MKILLAGATGFIGSRLRDACLTSGYQTIVLSRHPRTFPVYEEKKGEQFVLWDGRTSGEWCRFLEEAEVVINLAGENIAGERWTRERKRKILSSRTDATRAIIDAIGECRKKPVLLINASAVGYYGDVPSGEVTEQGRRGEGFLAEVCHQWEEEALRTEKWGVRVVLARLGPVIGENGGFLAKMFEPFRFFMGGPLGSGRQWIPWVHREDVVRAFLFMIHGRSLSGPVNVTAPCPVTMKEFCLTIGKIVKRPAGFSVPSFVLRGLMGEMAAIILEGACVVPDKLMRAGFSFQYKTLVAALEAALKEEG